MQPFLFRILPKVLKTYGRLQIDFPPKTRTALLKKMWSELEKAGVEYTATHYATLLTVLAENGQGDFSPEVITLNSIMQSPNLSNFNESNFSPIVT